MPGAHDNWPPEAFKPFVEMVAAGGLRRPPSQGWRTFLRNYAPDVAARDLFVVPTIGFGLLYAFVIVRLDRRDLVWINVILDPTAEWVARQITEAFPWNEAPRYLIRDRDRIYGSVVRRRLRAMGIRDRRYRASLAVAEWVCRTADRIEPVNVWTTSLSWAIHRTDPEGRANPRF